MQVITKMFDHIFTAGKQTIVTKINDYRPKLFLLLSLIFCVFNVYLTSQAEVFHDDMHLFSFEILLCIFPKSRVNDIG